MMVASGRLGAGGGISAILLRWMQLLFSTQTLVLKQNLIERAQVRMCDELYKWTGHFHSPFLLKSLPDENRWRMLWTA